MDRPAIGFLFLGGAHQVLHIAPVAMELERRAAGSVRLLVAGEAERAALIRLWRDSGYAEPQVEVLRVPGWARLLKYLNPAWSAAKMPVVLAARKQLCGFDAVIVAERTCTMLKRLPGPKPYLVHIPHGAGDRSKGFEPRIGLFDHVIVAGEKDRRRLVAEGICVARRVSVSGYVKLAAVRRLRTGSAGPQLFDNDRPTILYNPHFARKLGSWPGFGDRLITAFAAQQDYNLVVAPHVRLFENASLGTRQAIEARAIPGQIRVDLGSALSHDMSYTRGADIYVGDVSSQVYEFLDMAKPCVFLDPGIDGWRADPNFACWHLGEVVDDPDEALPAVRRAAELHAGFADRQVSAREQALGPLAPCPIVTAADLVAGLAETRRAARQL